MAQRNNGQIAQARLGRCPPNHVDILTQAFGQLPSLHSRPYSQE